MAVVVLVVVVAVVVAVLVVIDAHCTITVTHRRVQELIQGGMHGGEVIILRDAL